MGDIFDQIASEGDIFDQVSPQNTPPEATGASQEGVTPMPDTFTPEEEPLTQYMTDPLRPGLGPDKVPPSEIVKGLKRGAYGVGEQIGEIGGYISKEMEASRRAEEEMFKDGSLMLRPFSPIRFKPEAVRAVGEETAKYWKGKREQPELAMSEELEQAPWYAPLKFSVLMAEAAPLTVAGMGSGALTALATKSPKLGATVTGMFFGGISASQTMKEMEKAGIPQDEALFWSRLAGTGEAFIEFAPTFMFLKLLKKGKVPKETLEEGVGLLDKSLTLAKNMGKIGLAESIEEGLQTAKDNLIARETYAPYKSVLEDVPMSMGLGLGMGLLLGGGATAISASMDGETPIVPEIATELEAQAEENGMTLDEVKSKLTRMKKPEEGWDFLNSNEALVKPSESETFKKQYGDSPKKAFDNLWNEVHPVVPRGTKPEKKQKVTEKEESLATVVHRLGGLKQDGVHDGELRSFREGGGRINNRQGLTPDYMREAINQEGYEFNTIDEFFQAYEADLFRKQEGKTEAEQLGKFERKKELKEKTVKEKLKDIPFKREAPVFVDKTVKKLTQKWQNAPKINIIQTEKELPAHIRKEAAKGKGGIMGVFDPKTKAVYVVADNVKSESDITRTVLHETIGHYGLRGTLGKKIEPTLLSVYESQKTKADEIAKQYGIDITTKNGQMLAAEEVVAQMAESGKTSTTLRKVLFAIKKWFRSLGLKMEFTDKDILGLLGESKKFVEKGKKVKAKGEPVLKRLKDLTKTEAFKKWFGDSKVIDGKGVPKVVYHQTGVDFEAFDPKKTIGGQHWFTDNKKALETGEIYTEGKGVIKEVYLSIKKPAGWKEYEKLGLDEIIARGFDGLALPDKDGTTYVAFEPTQIKSVKNKGAFDPTDPRIAFKKAPKPALIELPEIVSIAKTLLEGEYPKIVKRIASRRGTALGVFKSFGRKGSIELRADLFKDPVSASKTLAHEIGHLVDWLPTKDLSRGNILGRVASLKKHMKTMLSEIPNAEGVLTPRDRARIKNQANKKSKGFSADKKSIDKTYAKKFYQEMLAEEVEKKGLLSRETVMEELKELTQKWKPFNDTEDANYTKYRYSGKELYADAISVLINDPAMLEKIAPSFYKGFFNYMGEKPIVKVTYEAIQERIEDGSTVARRDEELSSMLGERSEEALRAVEKEKPFNLWNKLKQELVDINAPLIKKVRKAQKSGIEVSPEDNPIHWLEELPYQASEYFQVFRDIDNEVVSVAEKQSITLEELGKYQFLTRVVLERTDIANPLGHTPATAQKQLDFLNKKWGDKKFSQVKTLTKKFYEIRKKGIYQTLKEAEIYDDEFMEMIENNEAYVTFDVAKYLEKRYGRGPSVKIHTQIGTLNEIDNPFIATMMKDAALLRGAFSKQTKQKTVEFIKKAYPDDLIKADRAKTKTAEFLEPRDPDLGLLAFTHKGVMEGYYIPKELADSFNRNPFEAGLITRGLELITAPLKELFVGKNIPWLIWNIDRDVFAWAKQMPGGGVVKALFYYAKSFPDAFTDVIQGKSTPAVAEMYKNKMLTLDRHYRSIENSPDDVMDRMLLNYGVRKKTYGNMVLKPFRWLWEQLDKPGKITERMGKIAGYKYLTKRGEHTPKEIAHIVRTRSGSPDFLRGGRWKRVFNSIFLFSNAGIGGLRAAKESAIESPLSYGVKTVMYDVIPTAIKYGGAIGLLGAGVKRMMDGIPDRDKENYHVVPLALLENGKTLYFVMPHDFQGQLVSGIAWKLMNWDSKQDIAGLIDYLGDGVPYSSINPWIEYASDIIDYRAGKNPYNEWARREIIPETVHEARGTPAGDRKARQYMIAHTWNSLGGTFITRIKVDQIKPVKEGIEKMLGVPIAENFARRFVRVSDWGLREELREAKQTVRRDKAELNLKIKEVLIKAVNQEELTKEDTLLLLQNHDKLGKKMLPLLTRKVGAPLVREYLSSRSNEEKEAVLVKWIDMHNLNIKE